MKTSPLKLDSALGHEAADKRIDILRRVAGAGSISEAARGAGVSYKAAWQAIDTLSNLAGKALVESAVGGVGGGGAHLTDAGRQLLGAADAMARARSQVLARLARQKARSVAIAGVAALGLRTSMRNQLPCIVNALKLKDQMVRVELALADDSVLASRITRESAQLLGLAPRLAVLALCKATAVQVTATRRSPIEGRNVLAGRVTRGCRAEAGGEVALQLKSGLQVVGFVKPGIRLAVGAQAFAHVDESAVVVGIGG